MPVVIDAEGGTNGADVQVLVDATDPAISYVTAGVNVVTAPVDGTDSRIVTREVQFPAAGAYRIYARVRIGPGGGNDDSFFIDTGTGTPTWSVANGISGLPVLGQPGYQAGAVIGEFGQTAPGRWMWALLGDLVVHRRGGSAHSNVYVRHARGRPRDRQARFCDHGGRLHHGLYT